MDFLGSGLGPSTLGSPGSGALVPLAFETYETQQLDLTVPNLGIELIPAKPGYVPVAYVGYWIIDGQSGTQTSAAVAQAGSDAGHSNFLASTATPSNAEVNGSNPPSLAISPNIPADTVKMFANSPVILDVTTAAQGTGSFSLLARLSISVFWISPTQ